MLITRRRRRSGSERYQQSEDKGSADITSIQDTRALVHLAVFNAVRQAACQIIACLLHLLSALHQECSAAMAALQAPKIWVTCIAQAVQQVEQSFIVILIGPHPCAAQIEPSEESSFHDVATANA